MSGGVISFWNLLTKGPQVVTTSTPLPTTAAAITPSTPKGYQQIVGLAAATALTVPAGSTYAVITTQGQAVRWRDDGTAPTAAIGMELLVGQALNYNGSLAAIEFIQEAATATLNISYYA